MYRFSVVLLAMLGMFVMAAAVQAEEAAKPGKKSPMVMGEVKSVDSAASSFVVVIGKADKAKEITVTVNAETAYWLDDAKSTIDDVVKVGHKVKVNQVDGLATKVQAITKAPAPKQPKEPKKEGEKKEGGEKKKGDKAKDGAM